MTPTELKAKQESLGLGLAAFAQVLGVTTAHLSQVYDGRRRVGKKILIGLSAVSDTPISELRRQAERELSAADGWMWPDSMAERYGVYPSTMAQGVRGYHWESRTVNGYTRYRMLMRERQPEGHCSGCAREITRNRTYLVCGVAICHPCHRRIFLGHDLVFARSIGVSI